MPFKALIFDMDGTIVDNMPYHNKGWELWFRSRGLPFDADGFFARTAGRTNREILREVFPQADTATLDAMGEEKEGFYREAYAGHVAPLPGLLELMALADRRGVPMAVGTAAPPGNIAVVLDALSLRARFRTIVSPSQGFRGKPHPDMFLAAAERMGVAPADCLVFEDAPLGVEAARNAGMKAVALLTMLTAADFAGFDNVIATAADFTALDHAALLA
jgi:beta-phosphoglucomutase family hydrolase